MALGRLEAAAIGGGGALAVLVGLDGSPSGQAARTAAVALGAAALVLTMRRVSAQGRGRAAVLAGIPALAVAVGFAPHWAKAGPLVVQVAATLLAVAGAALTVGGAAVATRGRRWPRRAAAAAGVVVATAVTAFVVGPAVAATNVPRPALGAGPATVGLAFDDVTLRTDDGVRLAGWYVRSTNGAAVVLLHGAGLSRSDVLEHAAVLAEAGFGVLMVDARGHGESGGRAMDFGWEGDADVAAATAFLLGRREVDPDRIGAVGLSMGGEEAIGASGDPRVLRAVVAEGATARTAADEAWLSERYGVRGFLTEQLEKAQDRVTDVLTSASVPRSLRSAVEASGSTRYLLITAGGRPEELDAASYVAGGAPDRVEVWTVPGAGHTAGLATVPGEWTQRVVGFLLRTLGG